MWQDQIDVFWDGRRTFIVGFFGTAEMARAAGLMPDIFVISARDAEFTEEPTLLDFIDSRRLRCSHCVLNLPGDHYFVCLRSPDGPELHFFLTHADLLAPRGEWRLLLTKLPDSSANSPIVFRLASSSVVGGLERLTRDQIARSGSKLVWAIGQRRQVERRDEAITIAHLWPACRAFPEHQSRVEIKALETPVERRSDMRTAPFAIMENWLRENGAPRVALRIEIPGKRDHAESILSRTSVVLVMHQRRHFRNWLGQQKALGNPIADELGFEEIRQATGHPLETPEAVESRGAIVVHNLLRMAMSPDTTDFDGVAIRRISDSAGADAGMVFEVDFFGATLGDDIGLVSTSAEAGDFGIIPSDPGGSPYVRLFRVEGDGLQPRKVDDDDVLLDEILRLSATREKTSAISRSDSNAEEAEGIRERRETFLASLNSDLASKGYDGRLRDSKTWDVFEPMLLTGFVSMVQDADPEARAALIEFGGYEAYRTDPSLTRSLIRNLDLAHAVDEESFRESQRGPQSLVQRFAIACRIPGLVGESADIHTQIRNWRIILQPALARHLTIARISLSGVEEFAQTIDETVTPLLQEANVERAIAYCDNLELDQEAKALRDYFSRRKAGEWTSFDEAERLSPLVQEAGDYWRRVELQYTSSEVEAAQKPESPKPAGIFAAMRNFFSRGSGR